MNKTIKLPAVILQTNLIETPVEFTQFVRLLFHLSEGTAQFTLPKWADVLVCDIIEVCAYFDQMQDLGYLYYENVGLEVKVVVDGDFCEKLEVKTVASTPQVELKKEVPIVVLPPLPEPPQKKVLTFEPDTKEIPKKPYVYTPEQVKAYQLFMEWIAEHTPAVLTMKRKITIEHYLKLKGILPNLYGICKEIPTKEITKILIDIENNKKYASKYASPYLCIFRWHERSQTTTK